MPRHLRPVPNAPTLSELLGLPPQPEWMAEGHCQGADPDAWYPERDDPNAPLHAARARRICESCPVREDCLSHALEHNERDGIWGGTTPGERRRIRRQALRPAS